MNKKVFIELPLPDKISAKKLGLKYYFTGKKCKRDHVSPRKVASNLCVECCTGYSYNQWLKDKEQLSDARRRATHNYYVKNKTRLNSNRKNYKNLIKKAFNNANRRSRKLERTPAWADVDAIELFYVKAKLMEWFTGNEYHVDHIIPLNGETVCGLHTQENLQVIPKHDNLRKRNLLLEEFEE